jgi:DNA-binding winged helix-turn-helix (wHTH) protein
MERDDNYFHFDAFRLDARERVLLRDGRLVPLPAKVLSTLLLLVRNNGRVVEKDFLMKEVWPDEYVEEGNLAQHIFILRRALGESTETPRYIETVPRRGYRFVANLIEPNGKTDNGIDSLAVLPFVNASNDPNMEYLSDGITEGVMNSLSGLPQLKVMARSTVFRYKGADIDHGRCSTGWTTICHQRGTGRCRGWVSNLGRTISHEVFRHLFFAR